MVEALLGFIIETLLYGLGHWIIKALSFGRYPGESSYWFGLCCVAGSASFLTVLALAIYLTST